MEKIEIAKIANYKDKNTWCFKNKRIRNALDTLGEHLGIEFGSITIKFHEGKWSPKIQIEKRLVEDIEK